MPTYWFPTKPFNFATCYLIEVRYKPFHARANESIVIGLALGRDHHDACNRLLRREGLDPHALELGTQTYFDFVEWEGVHQHHFHLYNDKEVAYLIVSFDTPANFYRWFLTHRDPEGRDGPKSYWPCEAPRCPVCCGVDPERVAPQRADTPQV